MRQEIKILINSSIEYIINYENYYSRSCYTQKGNSARFIEFGSPLLLAVEGIFKVLPLKNSFAHPDGFRSIQVGGKPEIPMFLYRVVILWLTYTNLLIMSKNHQKLRINFWKK